MITLFDIAREAQGGTGLPALARQLGLDAGQTQRVVEGLLPAFSLALRRVAQDATAFANLVDGMSSGRYAPFFDGASGLLPSGGGGTGLDALGQLFGSNETSRRVADQVSAVTGVGLQAVEGMMPSLAGMLLGGLFRHATADGYADALRRWSNALTGTAPSGPKRSPTTDPWSAWLEMAGSMAGVKPPAPKPEPDPLKPWADAVGAMWGAPRAPEPPPPPPAPNPFQAFSQMFEAGLDAQAQQLAGLQAVLDGAWGVRR